MKASSHRFSRLIAHFAGAALLLAAFGFVGSEVQAQKKRRTVRRASTTPSAFHVPVGTDLKIRLETEVNTKESKNGDTFTATVVNPSKYEGATVHGHVAAIKQSGKFKGQTALSLEFDKITLRSGESASMAAQVVRVYGEKSAKEVDEEGNVKSGGQGSTTVKRSAGGAAVGAVIGAIAGGGKGAAIGAAVGGAAGAGSVFITGTNKVKLDRGTEILIRTTR
ncbi:MAG TPA: YMGG-like glycine zipper-containing protein [Blastocatellia bacterium]|nr:YMGG-like glycine zipper-containing protein [Blastocatellia bacterium]